MPGFAPVEALWRANTPSGYFRTVDVTLHAHRPTPITDQLQGALFAAPEHSAQRLFVKCTALGVESPRHIKLVLPTTHGFLPRRNFFERRLLDCPFAEEITGFLVPVEKTELCSRTNDFLAIIAVAAAGILLRADATEDHLAVVEKELAARIGFIQAVKDLDVRLIVLGPKGPQHWLETPENAAGFCGALVPVNLAFGADLPARISAAVRGYTGWDCVDGMFTAHDRYLVATAQAAEMLGLPAAPVRAHEISTDKFAGVHDARQRIGTGDEVRYPAIVKPISGFASEGVAKVNSDGELFDSIAQINSARHGNVVIVETYIDGPEFDANFVLYRAGNLATLNVLAS
ncbi:hypothetical protein DFH08DRAFT_1089494 [Mycena albidolilacea]|uniref:ATP-grasp domain-containing protein n=1 Tax=Mycena albidolilacea TaxID=1033008 RepID=A0AAD6Z0U6_9AGAR|nr:hypothetical protein DFH08DRAFT_1089494 [Mycena albidolilacea]